MNTRRKILNRCGMAFGLVLLVLTQLTLAQDDAPTHKLIVGRSMVLSPNREIIRFAIGNERVAGCEVLSPTEVLLIGKQEGQTNVIFWMKSGEREERVIIVEQDLSPLRMRLTELDPQIVVLTGTEGELILTGSVDTYDTMLTAMNLASDFVDGTRRINETTQLSVDEDAEKSESGETKQLETTADGSSIEKISNLKVDARTHFSRKVRNLLTVRNMPKLSILDRLQTEAAKYGAEIRVRRIQNGVFPDDTSDSFVVEGVIASQAAYTQLLTVLDKILGGDGESFEVVADDGGGLADKGRAIANQKAGGTGGSQGQTGGLTSNSGTNSLVNNLESNIGRASIVQTKNKRLISFVKVDFFPQVIVAVRILELNRGKIKEHGVDWGLALSVGADRDFAAPASFAPGILPAVIGAKAINEGLLPEDRNVSSVIDGLFTNSFTIVDDSFVLNNTIKLLEHNDMLRTLSEPNLLTLSGEVATFLVGGQFPIRQVASTETAALEDVNFLEFGIRLSIRPIVSEDRMITLDVQPQISSVAQVNAAGNPVLDLTSLNTSVKLKSGQGVVLGGLILNEDREEVNKVPWLGDIAYIGRLFQRKTKSNGQRELALILLPEIVEPKARENFALEPPADTVDVRKDIKKYEIRPGTYIEPGLRELPTLPSFKHSNLAEGERSIDLNALPADPVDTDQVEETPAPVNGDVQMIVPNGTNQSPNAPMGGVGSDVILVDPGAGPGGTR